MKKITLFTFPLIVLLINSCVTVKEAKYNYILKPDYRLTISSGLDSSDDPIDNLENITLTDMRIYIHIDWFNIPNTRYQYTCRIYDGSGQKVRDSKMKFSPNFNEYFTWSSYNINENIDIPGLWKIEIYLDNILTIEKEIEVYSENSI